MTDSEGAPRRYATPAEIERLLARVNRQFDIIRKGAEGYGDRFPLSKHSAEVRAFAMMCALEAFEAGLNRAK